MSVISVADWEAIVSTHFSFLEERFHWTLWAKDDSGNWETTITYARDPAAVIVRCSAEFNRAEVELVRMVAGEIPPVPIFVHSNTRIDRCELDNLLLLRDSSMLEGLRNLSGLDRQTVDQALALQARALERYALSFLERDMRIFDEFDKLIKDRVARNPQRIRLSFPEGTPQEEIDRGVARAQRVDPNVPVEVHFYRRSSPPNPR
jgi:hypothetical protein